MKLQCNEKVWMLRAIATIIFSSALLAAWIAGAQEPGHSKFPVWIEYENSPNLPNGIAFHATLVHLKHFNTGLDFDGATEWVEQELGLDNANARSFVAMALNTLELMSADVMAQQAAHACEFAGAGVSLRDKYAAMQELYNIDKAVYEYHFQQTKSRLDLEAAQHFQEWIDERKLNISYVEIDFEQADQQSGRMSTSTLSVLCKNADHYLE